uniref:Uncharacterized protein n=1 Tax=Arundo donax TaxID=35708 RepID=A0A0A9BU18_ARUDO
MFLTFDLGNVLCCPSSSNFVASQAQLPRFSRSSRDSAAIFLHCSLV